MSASQLHVIQRIGVASTSTRRVTDFFRTKYLPRAAQLSVGCAVLFSTGCQRHETVADEPVAMTQHPEQEAGEKPYNAEDAELDWQTASPHAATIHGAKAHPRRPSMPLLGAKHDDCKFENCNLTDDDPVSQNPR